MDVATRNGSDTVPALPRIITAIHIVEDDSAPVGRAAGSAFPGSWIGVKVMVKRFPRHTAPDKLYSRIAAWSNLQHANLLTVFGASSDNTDPMFMITELQENGNISQYLAKKPRANRTRLLLDVAFGMQFLHENGIIHGSLKPSNILITDNGESCIADCGMIMAVPSADTFSHHYYSPEMWEGMITPYSDVYAFGMCMFDVLTSERPWGNLPYDRIRQLVVEQDKRPNRPEGEAWDIRTIPDDIWNLLRRAWVREERARPGFAEIISTWPAGLPPSPFVPESFTNTALPMFSGTPHPQVQPISPLSISQKHNAPGRTRANLVDRGRHAFPTKLTGTASKGQSTGPLLLNMTPTPRPLDLRSSSSSDRLLSEANSVIASSHRRENSAGPFDNFSLRYMSRHHIGPQASLQSSSHEGSPRLGEISRRKPKPRLAPLVISNEQFGRGRLPNPPGRHAESNQENRSQGTDSHALGMGGRSNSVPAYLHSVPFVSAGGASELAAALHAEILRFGDFAKLSDILLRMQKIALELEEDARTLASASVFHNLMALLNNVRRVDHNGRTIILVTLGALAHDTASANLMTRFGVTQKVIELLTNSQFDDIGGAAWCLSRICRSNELADNILIKPNLIESIVKKGLLSDVPRTSRLSAWLLGGLVRTDAHADAMAASGLIQISVDNLVRKTSSPNIVPEDICAATYLVARLSRSIKLSKLLARAGCVRHLANSLQTSVDPDVLNWSARAIGCLMRPNSLDLANILLEAGSAEGLARLPRVLPDDEVEPLVSFAFTIQRFVCAEWGGGTRKILVEAGVIDSLLSALRSASDVPAPHVHIELVRAISFLCDIGGGEVRKEIVRAGGVEILREVAESAQPEVAKACDIAVTSVTGKIWSRHVAVSKTALKHDWSGGCPDYLPPPPLFGRNIYGALEDMW